jgi:hypothetical protein
MALERLWEVDGNLTSGVLLGIFLALVPGCP